MKGGGSGELSFVLPEEDSSFSSGALAFAVAGLARERLSFGLSAFDVVADRSKPTVEGAVWAQVG
ncbi:MAG: hypothetical protein HYV07_19575 [Deltaproteobacteria bacterium]|nr:hypothetical protein [Deltaproteobacteria bacterium]